MGEGHQYQVLRCLPQVPGLQALLITLNATPDNFAAFVQAMRRQFKDVVLGEVLQQRRAGAAGATGAAL